MILKRGDLQVSATIAWASGERRGVRFDSPTPVQEWAGGKIKVKPPHGRYFRRLFSATQVKVGSIVDVTAGKVALIDFERPEQNDWLAVNQFVVINGQNNRRPDVVVFVNGLPLGVQLVELGPINATIHKVDECVTVAELEALTDAYGLILERMLAP